MEHRKRDRIANSKPDGGPLIDQREARTDDRAEQTERHDAAHVVRDRPRQRARRPRAQIARDQRRALPFIFRV
jgi:hypothetical protein